MSQKTTRQPDPLFDFDDRAKVNPKHTHICAHCGATGQPQKITKGSLGMELLLWLLFLFPGLLYSVWRLSTRYGGCPHCRAPDPVPLNTPRGQRLLADFYRPR